MGGRGVPEAGVPAAGVVAAGVLFPATPGVAVGVVGVGGAVLLDGSEPPVTIVLDGSVEDCDIWDHAEAVSSGEQTALTQ